MESDPFEEIAERTVSQAEAVRCDLPRFAQGMRTILEAVRVRCELAEDDARTLAREEGGT